MLKRCPLLKLEGEERDDDNLAKADAQHCRQILA